MAFFSSLNAKTATFDDDKISPSVRWTGRLLPLDDDGRVNEEGFDDDVTVEGGCEENPLLLFDFEEPN